jgi:heme A synthase
MQLFAIFYIMTALAMIVYYRRRVFRSVRDALILGLLPLGAAGFLGWMLVRTLQNSPSTQRWSLISIVALGLVMMRTARFVLRSPFFSIRRESDTPGQLTIRRGAPVGRPRQWMARAGLASQVSQSGR